MVVKVPELQPDKPVEAAEVDCIILVTAETAVVRAAAVVEAVLVVLAAEVEAPVVVALVLVLAAVVEVAPLLAAAVAVVCRVESEKVGPGLRIGFFSLTIGKVERSSLSGSTLAYGALLSMQKEKQQRERKRGNHFILWSNVVVIAPSHLIHMSCLPSVDQRSWIMSKW